VKAAAIALSARKLACKATTSIISDLADDDGDRMLRHIVGWDAPSSISRPTHRLR
jgi:hypothetical protein